MSSHDEPAFWFGLVVGLALVLPVWAALGWLLWNYL